MIDDAFIPLTPVHFFQLSFPLPRLPMPSSGKAADLVVPEQKKFVLPTTGELCAEELFAEVALGWHPLGIAFRMQIDEPIKRVVYPDFSRGDAVELFFDTRDVKTSGFNTRFCHHFFFLPEAVEGVRAGEMTHFRTEDRHEWCDADQLVVQTKKTREGYRLEGVIPAACLQGFDPDNFDRLGFSYRIHRALGPPQHFSVVTEEYQVEQQPALWSSLRLVS